MSGTTEQVFEKSKTGDANIDDCSSLKVESGEVCREEIAERASDGNSLDELYEKREVVAEWQVPSHGKLHKIEFEHGTTSGKRVLWIDGQEEFRRDWMFKLVGDDLFQLEDLRCVLRVDPAPSFKYKYSLFVDGKPLEQFKQSQAKAMRMWEASIGNKCYRIVLEKNNLNIYSNGVLREETGEFTDAGTETIWMENGNTFVLTAENSVDTQADLTYTLTINGFEIEGQ